jgi:hypothetical protein
MIAETWYPPPPPSKAKLADAVGLDPQLPADQPPVEPTDADGDESVVVNVDVEINPAAAPRPAASTCRCSATHPRHSPPQDPGRAAGCPIHQTQGGRRHVGHLIKGLRERLGFAEDADEATILAAIDEARSRHHPRGHRQGQRHHRRAGKAALDGREGRQGHRLPVVPRRAARPTRSSAPRPAPSSSPTSATRRSGEGRGGHHQPRPGRVVERDWDRDPASAKAELDKLTVARFPVGDAPGHGGTTTRRRDYTDEMAAEDAELFGLPKEAFAR